MPTPSTPPERPNPNTYWVIPGRLLAGPYPGHPDPETSRLWLQSFLNCGVTFFLDLTQRGELESYSQLLESEAATMGRRVEHRRLSITDGQTPHSRRDMARILDTIDRALADGACVYVHCRGGIGRTGTVAGCYLVRHGQTGDEALEALFERWTTSEMSFWWKRPPETPEQETFIRNWRESAVSLSRIRAAQVRYRGALLGLAVGDALGAALEFRPPGTFTPIDDLVGGGPFGLAPGQWTDDTSMALCLATSLTECRGFQPDDQMTRYVRWWQEGYLSSTGACFDIGNTVRAALERFQATGNPYAGSTDPYTAGNGSLMRLAPVPMFFAEYPQEAIERAAESSRTTHAAATAVDACRYFAGLLVGALRGVKKEDLLTPYYAPLENYWNVYPLVPEIDYVARGTFKTKDPPAIRGTGYVVSSLEAALWAFHRSDDFRTGALLAANLGDDADTTAAIYGQLAGAFYGASGIPTAWRERLAMRETIETLADRLIPPAWHTSFDTT